ncbi:hypothetical protein K431DRAFT_221544 [Polychaeton citri CBS 116435]|uniref:Uncharacterized protein n=1 Tax=Polychaeton citri CBS 116435 TaxID=1314669 RepID=A0A9P4QB91_9PEZI|nr:hypothetical protein K431DRAFT_221544 [Polychaeton citri CBS 116435]
MPKPPTAHVAATETISAKLQIVAALAIPTLISTVNLGLTASSWHSTGSIYNAAIYHRSSIQFCVQILSSILGALQLYVVSSVIRFRANIHLQHNETTLDRLKLLSALWSARFDSDLPRSSAVLLCLFLAAVQIPAAIWASSISPVLTTAEANVAIATPHFDASSSLADLWSQGCRPGSACGNQTQIGQSSAGTITYLPWKSLTGLAIDVIAQASSRTTSAPNRTKLDRTGFTYRGRSYGVGSTLGLLPLFCREGDDCDLGVNVVNLKTSTFFENGYDTNVNCMFNASSELNLVQQGNVDVPGAGSVDVWQATGSLPNGNWDSFPTWGKSTECVMAANDAEGRYLYGFITAGDGYYTRLNTIQCEVNFLPARFQVDVDFLEKSINVTKTASDNSTSSPLDIDPSGKLRSNIFMQLSYMSVTLTTLYTSLFANAFHNNIVNVIARDGNSVTEDPSSSIPGTNDEILAGIQESIEASLDAFAGAFGAAQSMLAQEITPADTKVEFSVAKFGETSYVYGSFLFNAVLILLVTVELVLTRFWRRALKFNIFDVKSAIMAVASAHDEGLAEEAKSWNGDGSDLEVGKIRLWLQRGIPALTTVNRVQSRMYLLRSETSEQHEMMPGTMDN